jgi:PPP family 3-phenylpropionic acid transporter
VRHRWLYARLSGFYLCYFGILGVQLPYWSLYLQSLGFSPARIGELTAIALLTRLFAPNLWGWLADTSGRRMTIVRLACLATLLCFTGVYAAGDSYWGLALVLFSFSFFWNAALPQFEVTTLNHLGQQTHRYSRIRLWGSVGFITAGLLGGLLVQQRGPAIVPSVLLVLFVALWLNSLVVPERRLAAGYIEPAPLGQILRQRPVVTLFLVCILNQLAHGPYYALFSIYLEGLGYSRLLIGVYWDVGVLAEIGLFLWLPRLLPQLGARRLLLLALALASLRWLLIGYGAAHAALLLAAQTLHAFSFGVTHVVAISLIHRFFTGRHQGSGQALYSSLIYGGGGALGSLGAGYLWDSIGASATYTLAALLSTLGLWVGWRGLRL